MFQSYIHLINVCWQSILLCLSGEYDEQIVRIIDLSMDQKDQKLLLLVQVCTV